MLSSEHEIDSSVINQDFRIPNNLTSTFENQKAKSKIVIGDTPPNTVFCVSAKFNKLQKYLIYKLLGFRVIDIKPSTEEK